MIPNKNIQTKNKMKFLGSEVKKVLSALPLNLWYPYSSSANFPNPIKTKKIKWKYGTNHIFLNKTSFGFKNILQVAYCGNIFHQCRTPMMVQNYKSDSSARIQLNLGNDINTNSYQLVWKTLNKIKQLHKTIR